MKSSIFFIYLLISLLVSSQVSAVEIQTSEIGLKASYCAQALKDKIPVIEQTEQVIRVRANDPTHPLKNEAAIQADKLRIQLEKTKIDLSRLQRYLILKFNQIDGYELLVAAASAVEDKKSSQMCSDKCPMGLFENYEKYNSCTSNCQIQLGNPNLRLQSCNNISWLPF